MNKEEKLLLNILEEITDKYNELLEENAKLVEQITYKADHDILTGVYNRSFFERHVSEYLKNKIPICFIFIDLDNFKFVNDNYGHEKGDEVLLKFSNILKRFFKGKDLISRYGGDEFVVAMVDCQKDKIQNLLHQLLEEIERVFKKYNVSISVGVSFFPSESKNFGDLIRLADERMYIIKKSGKNGINTGDEIIR
ncbi:MAG: GGDEF domain-containing protein [Epsilonproteobacteria bacterium]|nr:GGDEF domain-containing protein [Campylobacterota bacterium]